MVGQVSRETALRMQRDADALLFLGFDSPRYGGILTSKLFEYLASGTELLSVGYRRDESTAAMIESSRRGRDYGADTASIEHALRCIATSAGPEKFVDLPTARRIDRAASMATLIGLCGNPA